MGTSKSNSGPSGGIPLLPDWADGLKMPPDTDKENLPDGENLPDKEDQPDPITDDIDPPKNVWRPVRTAFASYLKNPSKVKLHYTVKRYVSANGGSKRIGSSAVAGRSTAKKLGRFLADVVANGTDIAFKNVGITDFSGKSVEFLFTKLAEVLSPTGNILDDPYARSAISDTLSKIYGEFELEDKNIDELNSLSTEQAKEFMEYFLASYIFERFISELGRTLIDKDYSSKEVVDKEFEIEEYIREEVKLELQDFDVSKIDFKNSNSELLISKIFSNVYSIFEKL